MWDMRRLNGFAPIMFNLPFALYSLYCTYQQHVDITPQQKETKGTSSQFEAPYRGPMMTTIVLTRNPPNQIKLPNKT